MTLHDNSKLIEVWLTKEEKADPALQAYLREQYRRYAEKKYTVAVFLSGSQDLVEETGELFRHNRRRFAEQEVQRRKNKNRETAGRIKSSTLLPNPSRGGALRQYRRVRRCSGIPVDFHNRE